MLLAVRSNTKQDELFAKLLERGIGLFDDGLSKVYRVAVELLYRCVLSLFLGSILFAFDVAIYTCTRDLCICVHICVTISASTNIHIGRVS